MQIKIKPGVVAVDHAYFWQPMNTCPHNAKVQLLGQGGVAVYGKWNGKDEFWVGWCPMPKVYRPPTQG